MATNSPKNKGKLELMLEEFSAVHGAVLLGMHKELQTVRDDVKKQVGSQLAQATKDISRADSALRKITDEVKSIHEAIDAREKLALQNIKVAVKDAIAEIDSHYKEVRARLQVSSETRTAPRKPRKS